MNPSISTRTPTAFGTSVIIGNVEVQRDHDNRFTFDCSDLVMLSLICSYQQSLRNSGSTTKSSLHHSGDSPRTTTHHDCSHILHENKSFSQLLLSNPSSALWTALPGIQLAPSWLHLWMVSLPRWDILVIRCPPLTVLLDVHKESFDMNGDGSQREVILAMMLRDL